MTKTFDTYSFGCRVNHAETEAVSTHLTTLGFQKSAHNPDVYLINTCAVTKKAEREGRQLIYQIKKKFPKAKVFVTGCAATKWNKENQKIEGIDFLVDNTQKEYLAQLIYKKIASSNTSKKVNQVAYTDKFISSGRLHIKIQDGCHRYCTFCIVPYLRGQPQSKRIQDLVSHINKSGDSIKEVTLAAINTEAYGRDTGESFVQLVDQIIQKTTVPRVSFGSIHPWSINDEWFSFYRKIQSKKRLVDFFHIPLQSGNNKILSLMKRGYTREEFVEKLSELKRINPFVFIGTDIIVGFLEETDEDFKDTYQFLKDSPISKFHIFRFSPREKTAAYFMKKRLKEPTSDEKKSRAQALADLHIDKFNQFMRSHVGHTFSALFLEKREGNYQHVLLSNQIPAVIHSPTDFRGQIKLTKIEEFKKGTIVGKVH